MTGILTSSGQFTFSRSVSLPNGTLTTSVPGGDVVISATDTNGKTIAGVTLQSSFSSIISYEDGASGASLPSTKTLSATPIMAELPATASISMITVSKNGKVLATTSLNGQILAGLISRIPDDAFRTHDPDDRDSKKDDDDLSFQKHTAVRDRNLLNDLVSTIQHKLDKGKLKPEEACEVGERLTRLISEIKRLTYRDYQVADQSELTQSEVLSDIQTIVKNLNLNLECKKCDRRW